MRAALLALTLTACSPTYHFGTRVWNAQTRGTFNQVKTCPTISMLFGDFVLTAAALGIATLKVNAGKEGEAAAYAGGGMAIALGANWAEIACRP